MMRTFGTIAVIVCLYSLAATPLQAQTQMQAFAIDSLINKESIGRFVAALADDSMKGRLTGTKENIRAAEFIAGELQKAGAKPLAGNGGYYMSFDIRETRFEIPAKFSYNVVAALPGKSRHKEIVIFCAHYDHIGTQHALHNQSRDKPTDPDGDIIYNGANDNASGVAAMLALAKYYGELKNNERTILFIAFSAEEIGLIGSSEFVANINPDFFTAVINLEMLGRTTPRSKNRPYITGHQYSDLITIFNGALAHTDLKKYGTDYFRKDPYQEEQLFARSDNYPFARLGIPAHTVMSGSPLDHEYHSVNDEYESLNIKAMTEFVRAIALAATPLVNGTATPKRINPKRIPDKKNF
ncbi:MAG TPA: M20/M25/M40 family metallo-hydrolase [Chitinophagaceae bacterium]|nr:M20/M25/M40 family metallo-hydrolase [Chitinophagaceae bacterium]